MSEEIIHYTHCVKLREIDGELGIILPDELIKQHNLTEDSYCQFSEVVESTYNYEDKFIGLMITFHNH